MYVYIYIYIVITIYKELPVVEGVDPAPAHLRRAAFWRRPPWSSNGFKVASRRLLRLQDVTGRRS